ncbi:unnamed protein product [Trichobilharzia regenti]|nr:unnamed protein product [Trichobilharzia regenti]
MGNGFEPRWEHHNSPTWECSLSVFDILLLACAIVLFLEDPFADDISPPSLPLSVNDSIDNKQGNISEVNNNAYKQLTDKHTDVHNITSNISTAHRIYSILKGHFVYPIALTAQTAAIWITVSLTVERYIAGCYPLHANLLSSVPKSRLVVCCCMICAVVYNIPRWFEASDNQSINTSDTPVEDNSSSRQQRYDWHALFRLVYYTWGYILVMFLLPFIALLVMNIRLMYALRRSDFAVHKNSHPTHYIRNSLNPYGPTRLAVQADKSITRMIIVVVGVFIACQLPALIFNIYFGIVSPEVLPTGWCALSEIRNFLVVVNSSVNFIVYCVMGAKFRRSFIHVITPCWEMKLTSSHNNNNHNNTQKSVVRLLTLRSDVAEV